MALCSSSVHSNHSKLSYVTAGKLSVKSQFTAHSSNKAMASEWRQSSTRGTGSGKSADLPSSKGNTVCRMKVF